MKINEFEKLEKRINDQNFHESYKTLNRVGVVISYFGHIASIFLSFFMLSKILFGVMDNKALVWVVTIITLSAIELLKRDIFNKFSVLYLKIGTFTKDVLPLFFLSIGIIAISFFSSIKGAGEYSHKGDQIEKNYTELNKKYEDSITKIYSVKIQSIENEKRVKEKSLNTLYNQQNELNNLALTGDLTKDQKKLLKSLPNQIKELERENKPFIDLKNGEIDKLNKERDKNISEWIKKSNIESNKLKRDNDKNSISFIVFSTLIEISILAGVYFNDYYNIRSWREKKSQFEKDPNYKKWRIYKQILDIIYTDDTKLNQKLPSNKSIVDMCKLNDFIVLPREIVDFLKTMTSLGIVKISGSVRYINKTKQESEDLLNKHFNIE